MLYHAMPLPSLVSHAIAGDPACVLGAFVSCPHLRACGGPLPGMPEIGLGLSHADGLTAAMPAVGGGVRFRVTFVQVMHDDLVQPVCGLGHGIFSSFWGSRILRSRLLSVTAQPLTLTRLSCSCRH